MTTQVHFDVCAKLDLDTGADVVTNTYLLASDVEQVALFNGMVIGDFINNTPLGTIDSYQIVHIHSWKHLDSPISAELESISLSEFRDRPEYLPISLDDPDFIEISFPSWS